MTNPHLQTRGARMTRRTVRPAARRRRPGAFGGSLAASCGLAALCLVFAGAASAAPGLSLTSTEETTSWTVLYAGQKVFVYAFPPGGYKPYVKELAPLGGEDILRDAPHDHLHHHALMYGIKINGLNFWEEVSGNGVQKAVQTSKPTLRNASAGALPQASLEQVLHWVAPQDAFLPDSASVALLVEHRTLSLTVDPASREVALEWKSRFDVGAKTNTVSLSGATYHGLGMRFRQDLDAIAVHSLAGVRPDLANNRQDLSTVPWAAVSFDAPAGPTTIALAGHPANRRGDATFFSMLTPFAYLSATQGLDKEPLIYHTGDTFELNYLILLYPEANPSERLRDRVNGWRQTPH